MMNKFNISGGFRVGTIAVIAASTLVGCSRKLHTDETSQYSIPTALKDCQIYGLNSDTRSDLVVVRCPNSSTTTAFKEGKQTRHVSTIETDLPLAPPTPPTPETVTVDGKTYKLER